MECLQTSRQVRVQKDVMVGVIVLMAIVNVSQDTLAGIANRVSSLLVMVY